MHGIISLPDEASYDKSIYIINDQSWLRVSAGLKLTSDILSKQP